MVWGLFGGRMFPQGTNYEFAFGAWWSGCVSIFSCTSLKKGSKQMFTSCLDRWKILFSIFLRRLLFSSFALAVKFLLSSFRVVQDSIMAGGHIDRQRQLQILATGTSTVIFMHFQGWGNDQFSHSTSFKIFWVTRTSQLHSCQFCYHFSSWWCSEKSRRSTRISHLSNLSMASHDQYHDKRMLQEWFCNRT